MGTSLTFHLAHRMTNIKFFTTVLILAGFAYHGSAECPADHEEIPTLWDDDTFNCAMVWQGPGNDSPLNSCCDTNNDDSDCCYRDGVDAGWLWPHGYDNPGQDKLYYPVGSYLVKPGCTVTWWKNEDYHSDDWAEVPGLVLNPKNKSGKDDVNGCWEWGWGSFKCRCQQKMPDCTPTDSYDTILTCDNTGGSNDLACSYQQSIGTVYSESTTESMGIDQTISVAISAGLFDLFEVELGFSVTTSYDWTHTSELTMSVVETITVEAVASPGTKLVLDQAVGQCGDEQPRTELFRTSDFDKEGKLISVNYERRGNPAPPAQSPRERLEAAKGGLNGKWNRGNHTLKAVPAF